MNQYLKFEYVQILPLPVLYETVTRHTYYDMKFAIKLFNKMLPWLEVELHPENRFQGNLILKKGNDYLTVSYVTYCWGFTRWELYYPSKNNHQGGFVTFKDVKQLLKAIEIELTYSLI